MLGCVVAVGVVAVRQKTTVSPAGWLEMGEMCLCETLLGSFMPVRLRPWDEGGD